MKSHLVKFLPLAAALAWAFPKSPLQADSPVPMVLAGGGSGGHVHASPGGSHVGLGGSGSHLGGGIGRGVFNRGGGSAFASSHVSLNIHRGPRVRVRYGFVYPPLSAVSTAGSAAFPYDGAAYGSADADADPSGNADANAAVDPNYIDPRDIDPSTGYPTAPGTVPNMSASIQVALANAGYYHGAINGVIGGGSKVAIASFQRAHGMPATGLVDIYLLHALGLYQ